MKCDLSSAPLIMGCMNVTPDSFFAGSRSATAEQAIAKAYQLLEDGADIIDIGAESARPGAKTVDASVQVERLVPVVQELKQNTKAYLSIDTANAQVMQAMCELGVDMINDINALQAPTAVATVASYDVDICLMHKQGTPKTMQDAPRYNDLFQEISHFFSQRIKACADHGIQKERICLDPGFGFGKTLAHNYQILAQLEQFKSLACPLLIGLSRKSMIGEVTQRAVEDRMVGSVAGALIAAMNGAHILRVHDVRETIDAIKIYQATKPYRIIKGDTNA